MVRLFYCSDIHGAEGVWKKFLNTAKYFDVDILIFGGDIAGKKLAPVISQPDGTWKSPPFTIYEKEVILRNEQEVVEFETKANNIGYYTHRMTSEEAEELLPKDSRIDRFGLDKDRPLDKLFKELECKKLQHWLDMIDDITEDGTRRVPDDTRIVFSPGNDDRFELDDIVKQDSRITHAENMKIDLDGNYEMICYGWVNPSPWNTFRENTEEVIEKNLDDLVSTINDFGNSVFCIHCPPYGSYLDRAPLLTKDLRIAWGGDNTGGGLPRTEAVGSKSVHSIIKKCQPLLSLHGHIHESPGRIKIGQTYCLNSGSRYSESTLSGFLIELQKGQITRMQSVET